jgi:hypothetical protein
VLPRPANLDAVNEGPADAELSSDVALAHTSRESVDHQRYLRVGQLVGMHAHPTVLRAVQGPVSAVLLSRYPRQITGVVVCLAPIEVRNLLASWARADKRSGH